jgi:hypothetical protein
MFGNKIDLQLTWSWPTDGKRTDWRLIVQVSHLGPCRKFQWASPSMLGNLPEPFEILVTVVAGRPESIGKKLQLIVPKGEIGDLKIGDLAGIAVHGGDKVIGIKPLAAHPEPQHYLSMLENWSPTLPT